MPVLLLLSGCAPETGLVEAQQAPEGAEEAEDTELPSPYLVDDTGSSAEPLLSPDDIAVGIEAALSEAFAVDPAPLFAAAESIWAGRDDGDCPYYYPEYLDLYSLYIWSDSCTAASGNVFDGNAYYYFWDNAYTYYYGTYTAYDYFYGDATLTRADGQFLEASGYAYYYNFDSWSYSGYRQPYALLQGSFEWTGADYADTWLSKAYSLDLYTMGLEYTSGGRSMQLEGSIGGLSGDINAATFTELYMENTTMGTLCGLEPGGTAAVRDAEGNWYDVIFHGPAFHGASVFPAECDGCGQVFWRGEELGEVCPDFGSLVDWEERPWN